MISLHKPPPSAPAAARTALASRLRSAGPVLLPGPVPAAAADAAEDAAVMLDLLVHAVAHDPGNDRIWLLLVAVSGRYPDRDEVDDIRREFDLTEPAGLSVILLDHFLAAGRVDAFATLHVVQGGLVVDVNHSARFNLHTGIQRVTRNLLPRWAEQHGVLPAAWTPAGALRGLTALERERLLDWARYDGARDRGNDDRPEVAVEPTDTDRPAVIVPWRSTVVVAEVPHADVCQKVAAIGAYSGNRLAAIGYDTIPLTSAEMVPVADAAKFVQYLSAIKFATVIAGISAASAGEFAGFAASLATQGLPAPTVVAVPLPDATGDAAPRDPVQAATEPPMILVVGSHEPRKNHLAVLHAAERLWREGQRFSLTFIGGSGWGASFPQRVDDLRAAGRDLAVIKKADERTLADAYASARFTVFPSLHEGYGLPVAESLAFGTPVITSGIGSTAELATGGVITIDPRSDGALTDAMRGLLNDDRELARARGEIAERPPRTWQDYADELWTAVADDEVTGG